MKTHLIVAFACVSLLLASCKGTKPTIVGKWQQTDPDGSFEFRSDGSMTLVNSNGKSSEAKYRVDGDKTIIIMSPDGREANRMTIESLTKDELVLTGSNGTRKALKRIQKVLSAFSPNRGAPKPMTQERSTPPGELE
jgi:uncharacterized protein (TIGR03066 family)